MSNGQHLIVLSGPAGSGKDTVVQYLVEHHPEVEVSVSMTTRDKRPGEREGVNYYYISTEEFERRIAAGEALEYTNYCGNYYGTPKSEVDKRIEYGITVILVIEVVGAANVKRIYPGATTIFVLPPNMEELERRLRVRGSEDEATIQKRLRRAETEIARSADYDEHVVNDVVEDCADRIFSIIQNRLAQPE